MNVSKVFIKRPVMTTLLMLPILVFGFVAFKLLPVSSIPVIETTVIEVSTSYPGASADEIARVVSGPLEREFMLMQGIEFVSSNNTYESSEIVLQFHEAVSIDVAAEQVQNAITKAQGQLPKDLPNPPVYSKTNPSDTPVIYCVLYSDEVPAWTLYEYGYNFLAQQLGTIKGVGNIHTYGYPYATRIEVDPEALASKKISLEELSQAINRENADLPTGKFYSAQFSVLTKTHGELYKAKDYENIIVKYERDQPVRIKDIAAVSDSLLNDKIEFKWITKEREERAVVCLAIFKQLGFNTLEVCSQIENLLTNLQKDLPGSIQFAIPFSQSKYIKESVSEVQLTLLVAFFLVVIVVFFYLGRFRNSMIPLVTLPITVLGTFILMWVFGYSIDIMSMSALTLAIGFLVDDAIVVLENIVRYIEMRHDPHEASLKGTEQIALTIVSISVCLGIVFVPLLFIPGLIGHIFHEFAAVILIAVLFSGFISLSLTPMLSSRFLKAYAEEKKGKVFAAIEEWNNRWIAFYIKALQKTLSHKKWVVGLCLFHAVASAILFFWLPKEFLPSSDLSAIQGFIVTKSGTSPEKMNSIMKEFQKICCENPYITTFVRMTSTPTDNQGFCFINLVDSHLRPSIDKVIDSLSKRFDEELIGAKCYLKAFPLINLQVGTSGSGKGSYQYILQSLKDPVIWEHVPLFLEALSKRKELSQVSSDLIPMTPGLHVDILRDQAHAFGHFDATSVENTLMYTLGETYISEMRAPENLYYVILEGNKDAVADPSKLQRLYLNNEVALEGVIDTHMDLQPLQINHINTLASATISFDVADGYALGDAIKAIEEEASSTLPSEIFRKLAGGTAAFKKIFIDLSFMILLAIFVIYIVLGILYENFIYPLAPLSALPIAMFGGLATLWIFQQFLSVYAMIGLIMLIGIVMKNGILMVDFALELIEKENTSPQQAIVDAARLRFRPILMTTLAAMMGAVPIALGIGGTVSEGRAPLGMVVIGGLFFSQIVTLFVIPVFFILNYELENLIRLRSCKK